MATITPETEEQLDSILQTVRGRKSTRENKRAFLRNLFVANCNATSAAAMTNIARRSIYSWRAKDPAFSEAMNSVEALFQGHITNLVIDEAEQGNDRLISLAARKMVPKFADQPQVSITNNAIINPDRSHEERMARTREIMETLGYTVTKDNLDNLIEGKKPRQITNGE